MIQSINIRLSTKVKHFEELTVNTSTHSQHDCEALALRNVDFNRLAYHFLATFLERPILFWPLGFKLSIQRQDLYF